MKIITVNLPVSYIETIESLIGDNGLYPSRSELIRVAIREFLIRELEAAKNQQNMMDKEINKLEAKIDDKTTVRIPIERKVGMDTVKDYKVYRIIQK